MAGESKVNRTRYTSAEGLTIVLEVPQPPMGDQSGFIPPPVIEFYKDRQPVRFVYQGDE